MHKASLNYDECRMLHTRQGLPERAAAAIPVPPCRNSKGISRVISVGCKKKVPPKKLLQSVCKIIGQTMKKAKQKSIVCRRGWSNLLRSGYILKNELINHCEKILLKIISHLIGPEQEQWNAVLFFGGGWDFPHIERGDKPKQDARKREQGDRGYLCTLHPAGSGINFTERNINRNSINYRVLGLIRVNLWGTIRLWNARANYSLNEALGALLSACDLAAPRSRFPF